MPRSEKAKLKAEILTCEHDLKDSETADLKSLGKRIHEAYLKNFNMNKVKARVILAGKTSNNPVGASTALGTLKCPLAICQRQSQGMAENTVQCRK
jgi:hypothetical protein